MKKYKLDIDPLVKQLTVQKIKDDIKEFNSLLDKPSDETKIQMFLENHSYFFNNIIRLYGASPLLSKIMLGSEYEIDFACFDAGSVGPEWRLIEIESPKHSLFTKSGELTANTNHAIQQVRDWQIWVEQNIAYARKTFPQIIHPRGYIFIGRRSEYTPASRSRLEKINTDARRYLEVHSLDWFSSAAESVVNLVDGRNGSWPLPMCSLKQADIKNGLPEYATDFIDAFMKKGRIEYPEEFLRERRL